MEKKGEYQSLTLANSATLRERPDSSRIRAQLTSGNNRGQRESKGSNELPGVVVHGGGADLLESPPSNRLRFVSHGSLVIRDLIKSLPSNSITDGSHFAFALLLCEISDSMRLSYCSLPHVFSFSLFSFCC